MNAEEVDRTPHTSKSRVKKPSGFNNSRGALSCQLNLEEIYSARS
jgi:hypothetical protein